MKKMLYRIAAAGFVTAMLYIIALGGNLKEVLMLFGLFAMVFCGLEGIIDISAIVHERLKVRYPYKHHRMITGGKRDAT